MQQTQNVQSNSGLDQFAHETDNNQEAHSPGLKHPLETETLMNKNPRIAQEKKFIYPQKAVIPLDDTMVGSENKDSYTPNPIEIIWKNLKVDIQVKKNTIDSVGKKKYTFERRHILNNISGCIKPGEFTAILGPSGCGKTTLLNFLSGRILGTNIEVTGDLILNGKEIHDIDEYSNQIAYVMQDDILLATFTPKEAFKLTADLRLKNLSDQQKIQRVDRLIKELGLTRCKNTKVGNSLIRGISGGERKRTSIGVELLTNPSMLFLDEPTTGLDSSTALQVVELLKTLSRRGVNVMSTIHQPSSEIFNSFERLILICKGSIIYQGLSKDSVDYFHQKGFTIPAFSNPSDYYMKLMNPDGLQVELAQKGQKSVSDQEIALLFEKRLSEFLQAYNESPMALENKPSIDFALSKNDDSFNVSKGRQFFLLFQRSFLAQIRNPMDTLMKIFQSLVFGVICIIVFQPLGTGLSGFQNRVGVLQFLTSTLAFGAIQGSITTFSSERSLFIRERLSKSYGVGPYFWGKSLAEVPFQLIYPIVLTVMTYYSMGLNDQEFSIFIILNIIMICTQFYGSSYGLCVSVLIPKLDVAMAVLPIFTIPMMVLGGFFVNTNNVPKFLIWIEYISMFKYSFQAAALNEFKTINFDAGKVDPLGELGISETLVENILILLALGVAFRVLCYLFMFIISTPSKPKLNHKIFKAI